MSAIANVDFETLRAAFPKLDERQLLRLMARDLLAAATRVDPRAAEPPVRIQAVAVAAGVSAMAATELPPGIAGVVRPEAGGSLVLLNEGDPLERQRFTALHEIAHTFLPGGDREQFRCSGSSQKALERAASLLAAEMLFPYERFREQVVRLPFGMSTVERIACFFGASIEASAFHVVDVAPYPTAVAVYWLPRGRGYWRSQRFAGSVLVPSYERAAKSWPVSRELMYAKVSELIRPALNGLAVESSFELESGRRSVTIQLSARRLGLRVVALTGVPGDQGRTH